MESFLDKVTYLFAFPDLIGSGKLNGLKFNIMNFGEVGGGEGDSVNVSAVTDNFRNGHINTHKSGFLYA